jgi:hypothetical protein
VTVADVVPMECPLWTGRHAPWIVGMVTFRADTCDKCKNASPVSSRVEPEASWKTVVLNRWHRLCPGCYDVEAEKADALQLQGPRRHELVRSAGTAAP